MVKPNRRAAAPGLFRGASLGIRWIEREYRGNAVPSIRNLAAVPMMVASLAAAQPAAARDPAAVAAAACQDVVQRKALHQHSADRAQFLGNPKARQVSNAETGIRGKRQLDTKSGWVPFSYDCIYNIRNGSTNHVSIRADSGPSSGKGSNDSSGAVAGAILGAVIAGAVIAAIADDADKNTGSQDSGWWSPADGVRCNPYQSSCYKNGQYSGHWTHKIYK